MRRLYVSTGSCCKGICWNAHNSLHCMLVGVTTEITLQPVRRYMVLFVTQDKSNNSTGGRGILSMDRFCAACHGRIHLESIWCHMIVGCPASDGMLDLITVYIPLFILYYQNRYFIMPFVVGSSTWTSKKNSASCLSLTQWVSQNRGKYMFSWKRVSLFF